MILKLADLFPEISVSALGRELDVARFTQKRVVIIGGAGSIGSEVLLTLLGEGAMNIEIWDCDESRMHTLHLSLPKKFQASVKSRLVDIRIGASIALAFKNYKPQVVIHAAALKHVSILERQPLEAYLTNVVGTALITREIMRNDFVEHSLFISSDKAANPVNILGKTKLIGEYIWSYANRAHQSNTVWSVVRFGNVFLSRGSVVETFLSQIQKGEEITITHPSMTRYFLDLSEAARMICYILTNDVEGISILKMGSPIKIDDLANRLMDYLGKRTQPSYIGVKEGEKISEDLFAEYELNSVLDNGSFFNIPFQFFLDPNPICLTTPTDDESALQEISSLFKHFEGNGT